MSISAWFYLAIVVDDLITRLIIITLVIILEIFTIESFIAPQWNDILTINEIGINGLVRRRTINILWKDVKAIWQPETHSWARSILISTTRGLEEIFIGHLGRQRIWAALRKFGPPEILVPGKYRSTYDYIKLYSLSTQVFERVDFLLRSNQYPARIVGWFGLFLFASMTIISIRYLICFVPIYGLGLLMSIVILLGVGSLEFDPESITYSAWMGQYRLRWDQILWIEQEPTGGWLLLYGENKRLGIPGPSMWSGRSKEIMRLFYQFQLLERDIMVKESIGVNFRFWSRNTRVGRDK